MFFLCKQLLIILLSLPNIGTISGKIPLSLERRRHKTTLWQVYGSRFHIFASKGTTPRSTKQVETAAKRNVATNGTSAKSWKYRKTATHLCTLITLLHTLCDLVLTLFPTKTRMKVHVPCLYCLRLLMTCDARSLS